MSNAITEFKGEYRWLSNFWPCAIEFGGIVYPTIEHAYVATKSMDREFREKVLYCKTPGQAKRLGKSIIPCADHREFKVDLMRNFIKQKFQRPDLKERLLETGSAVIEEGNTWGDTFWGISPVGSGNGQNILGKLIMDVRAGNA